MESRKRQPPQLPLRFFRWYCHPKLQDYIEGDLMEVYERRVKEIGKRKADIRFAIDVLLLFRPGIIRPPENYQSVTNYAMLANYIKIALRIIRRNKGYSFINISGLAIGLAAAMLILLWVNHEASYDRFYSHAYRIYKCIAVMNSMGR